MDSLLVLAIKFVQHTPFMYKCDRDKGPFLVDVMISYSNFFDLACNEAVGNPWDISMNPFYGSREWLL